MKSVQVGSQTDCRRTEAINDFRRRKVISLTGDAIEMPAAGDLAEAVGAMEDDYSTGQLTAQQRKHVYAARYTATTHFP